MASNNYTIDENNLNEFLDAMLNIPAFENKDFKNNIKNIFKILFDELYNKNPEDLINFLSNGSLHSLTDYENTNLNKYTEKTNLDEYYLNYWLMKYGIKLEDAMTLNNNTKSRMINIINELIRTKGTTNTLILLSKLLEDFIGSCNIYNIVVTKSNNTVKDETQKIIMEDKNLRKYFLNYYNERMYLDEGILSDLYFIDKNGYYYKILEKDEYQKPSKLILNDEIIKLDYQLDDVYISDSFNKLTSLSLGNINHPKFIMQLKQFLDEASALNIKNNITTNSDNISSVVNKYNVFPIKTNLIYMQYTNNFKNDEYTDLLFKKASLSLGTKKFNIKLFNDSLDSYVYQLSLVELINILNYIKLREVYFKYLNNDNNSTDHLQDFLNITLPIFMNNIDGFLFDESIFQDQEHVFMLMDQLDLLDIQYKNLQRGESTKDDLYNFINDFYDFNLSIRNDIYLRSEIFTVENNINFTLLNNINNITKLMKGISSSDINNLDDFTDYIIAKNNENDPVFSDPNFINSVIDIIETFNIKTYDNFLLKLEELFQDEYVRLMDSFGSNKLSRLITKINTIGTDKKDLSQKKSITDNYINQFIQVYREIQIQVYNQLNSVDPVYKEQKFLFDTIFMNFIMGNEYSKIYLHPILNLFRKYFLNAELLIKENSFNGLIVKDKTQDIYVSDKHKINFTAGYDYKHLIKDNHTITIYDRNTNTSTVIDSRVNSFDTKYKADLALNLEMGYVNIIGPDILKESFTTDINNPLYSNTKRIYNFTVALQPKFGPRFGYLPQDTDYIISIRPKFINLSDSLLKSLDNYSKLTSNNLAEPADLNLTNNISVLIKAGQISSTFQLEIPEDFKNEEDEYFILEPYSITKVNGEITRQGFQDIQFNDKLLKIESNRFCKVNLSGDNLNNTTIPFSHNDTNVNYKVSITDNLNNPITSKKDIKVSVIIKNDLIGSILSTPNFTGVINNTVKLGSTIDTRSIGFIKPDGSVSYSNTLDLVIPAGQSQITFSLKDIGLFSDIDFFKLELTNLDNNTTNTDFDKFYSLPTENSILFAYKRYNSVSFDIIVPESIREGIYTTNDTIKIITDTSDRMLRSFGDINFYLEFNFYSASVEDLNFNTSLDVLDVPGYPGSPESQIGSKTLKIKNLHLNPYPLKAVLDELNELTESFSVKLGMVEFVSTNINRYFNLLETKSDLKYCSILNSKLLTLNWINKTSENIFKEGTSGTSNVLKFNLLDENGNIYIPTTDINVKIDILKPTSGNYILNAVDTSDYKIPPFGTIKANEPYGSVVLQILKDAFFEDLEGFKIIFSSDNIGTDFYKINPSETNAFILDTVDVKTVLNFKSNTYNELVYNRSENIYCPYNDNDINFLRIKFVDSMDANNLITPYDTVTGVLKIYSTLDNKYIYNNNIIIENSYNIDNYILINLDNLVLTDSFKNNDTLKVELIITNTDFKISTFSTASSITTGVLNIKTCSWDKYLQNGEIGTYTIYTYNQFELTSTSNITINFGIPFTEKLKFPFRIRNITTTDEDFMNNLLVGESIIGLTHVSIPINFIVDYYEDIETFSLEFDNALFCELNNKMLFNIPPRVISLKEDYSNYGLPLFKLFYTSSENFYEDTTKFGVNNPIKIYLTKIINNSTGATIPYRFFDYGFTLTLGIKTGKSPSVDATGNTDFNTLFIPINFPANVTEIDFDLSPYIVNDGTPKTLEIDEYFNLFFASILFPDNTDNYHSGIIDLSYTNNVDMKLISPDVPLPPVTAVVDGAPNNSISILTGDSFNLDLSNSFPIMNIDSYEWKDDNDNIITNNANITISFDDVNFNNNISTKYYYKVTGKDNSVSSGFVTVYNNAHPEVWLDQSNERYGSLNTSMIFGGLGYDPEDGYIVDINWYILNDDNSKTEIGTGYEVFYSFSEARTYNVVAKVVDVYFAETYEHITVIIQ